MNPRLAHLLVRMYPRGWRERYGEEFEQFLESERGGVLGIVDIVLVAVWERFLPTVGGSMEQATYSYGGVMRKPSAFVPVAMSVVASGLVLGYVAMYGAARQRDEGAVAHLWQLLMVGQLPLMVWFAVRWLPSTRWRAVLVLAQQVGFALASMGLVFFLGLG